MGKGNILILVESPNKVLTIKNLLKGTDYERAVIKASVGHISLIKDNTKSYHNSGIHPNDNFKTDYAIDPKKKKVVTELLTAVSKAETVFICSDPDREGEAIAWSLKKFLKIPESKYKRATYHELTKKAIVEALDNPRKIDNDMVDAAHARAILDKLIGYSLSPIARDHVSCKSVGRCQSAGLKLIADRENEILNFKPEKYFDLYVHFEKNKTQFKAKYIGTPKKRLNALLQKKNVKKLRDCVQKTLS